MYCFVILLLFNEMQMSVRRFSAIPHLRGRLVRFLCRSPADRDRGTFNLNNLRILGLVLQIFLIRNSCSFVNCQTEKLFSFHITETQKQKCLGCRKNPQKSAIFTFGRRKPIRTHVRMAPISDRFRSLCARVFSRAAAILKSEKTLGTRLTKTEYSSKFKSPCYHLASNQLKLACTLGVVRVPSPFRLACASERSLALQIDSASSPSSHLFITTGIAMSFTTAFMHVLFFVSIKFMNRYSAFWSQFIVFYGKSIDSRDLFALHMHNYLHLKILSPYTTDTRHLSWMKPFQNIYQPETDRLIQFE